MVFKKCNQLPIHNFNEIATTQNLNFLKKDQNSEVPEEELQQAWLDILDEYFRISNNNYALQLFRKKIKVITLEKKLNVLEIIRFCLEKGCDVSEEMKMYRVTKENLTANIGLIQNDIIRITKTIPKEEFSKDETEFDRTIAIILKNGFQINRFTTVVSEWCAILNLIEQQQKANK
jgi:hypothetical protein